jgi:hypothetical protein
MKLVPMEGVADCAAACLAMAFGLSRASQVYPMLGYNPSNVQPLGVSDLEVVSVLRMMNVKFECVTPREELEKYWNCEPGSLSYRIAVPTRAAIAARLGSQLTGYALVAVPSLTHEGSTHYVFCRKGETYDPSVKELRYNGTANSLPALLAIFIEG